MNGDRPCTCPPMERPHPCARKFALSECDQMSELLEQLRFIRTHLYAATVQRSQTDDRIIADHIEQAYRRVNEVIKVMEKRDE